MNLWRDIVDSLNVAVIALSADLDLLSINPAGEALLGASPNTALVGDLLGRNGWLHRMVRQCLKSGQDLSDPEAKLVLPARVVSVRAEVSPLLREGGHAEGAILLMRDLSHQLEIKGTSESDEEARLGLSPAGLAHEVKNPLAGIKGAAELLAGLFKPTDHRAQQYCGLILDGVNRITALVEQVLAVSGPLRLKREPVNIHRVLHQALALAGLYPAPQPGITVEQLFDPSLPEVCGDEAALERVFLNLVKNAVEAIGAEGTIRLVTRIEPQFRRTADGAHRQFLRVEVSDSGSALSPGDVAELFTPFFTTKPGGTGLGLVLSQRIVALHGGKLWVEAPATGQAASKSDEVLDLSGKSPLSGLTFKVTLPIAPGGAEP